MSETVVRVCAPHFTAGAILRNGIVVRAAPILKWSLTWPANRLSEYLKTKGWPATQWTVAEPEKQ